MGFKPGPARTTTVRRRARGSVLVVVGIDNRGRDPVGKRWEACCESYYQLGILWVCPGLSGVGRRFSGAEVRPPSPPTWGQIFGTGRDFFDFCRYYVSYDDQEVDDEETPRGRVKEISGRETPDVEKLRF